MVVLKEVLKLYDDLIKEYEKVYERESKDNKSDSWKEKYDPTNFTALNYQPVELKQNHCLMKIDLVLNNQHN